MMYDAVKDGCLNSGRINTVHSLRCGVVNEFRGFAYLRAPKKHAWVAGCCRIADGRGSQAS